MTADAKRFGRVLQMRRHTIERLDVVEEGRIDIDGGHRAAHFAKRLGEYAASNTDLEHVASALAMLDRLSQNPVAARAVQPAAGCISVFVKRPLEGNVALSRTPLGETLNHPRSFP